MHINEITNKTKKKRRKNMKNLSKKILMSVLLAIIIICAIIKGTNSKYVSDITGDGVADVAKWSFSVNDGTESIKTINLTETYDKSTLIDGKIAPGTSGSFDLVIDATGAEVGIEYKVDFKNETNKPTNLKFTYENETFSSLDDYEEYFTGTINASDTNRTRTLTVMWEWPYETGSETNTVSQNDTVDTNDGLNDLDYTFDVVVTGKQVVPQVASSNNL